MYSDFKRSKWRENKIYSNAIAYYRTILDYIDEMGKQRKSASSVKLANKSFNKSKNTKRSNKSTKTRKSQKLSQKANNLALAKQRNTEDLEEEEVYEAPQRKPFRKNIDNDAELRFLNHIIHYFFRKSLLLT